MLLWVPKRIAIHAPSFPNLSISPLHRARQKCPSACFVLPVPLAQLPTRSVLFLRRYFRHPVASEPSYPNVLIHSNSPASTKFKTNRNPRTLTGPQSYLYPLSQLTIFPRMSCVVAELHVVLTEKEGRRHHYPYSGICGAVRLGLGPSVCEVHTKVRTKVCTKSENLRRNQLKGAEQ
jgi:hypothetical protein